MLVENTFFNNTHLNVKLATQMTHDEISTALRMIEGIQIVSITPKILVVSNVNPKINEDFLTRYLLDFQLRMDIEKELCIDTKHLVQNIINASLGTTR